MYKQGRTKTKNILDAIYVKEPLEFTREGPEKGRIAEFVIARYIYRAFDLPEYRIAVPEQIHAENFMIRDLNSIKTRTITYVPTGRIIFDNELGGNEPYLFEYCLREARDVRALAPT